MLPVVQNRVPSFNAQFEGYIHHMYLDVKGFVTVGVGNLLGSAAAATALPFTHGLTGAPASAAEKAAAWNAVKAAPAGRQADFYAALTDLRLNKAAIDSLVLATASSFDAQNPSDFPDYPSFCADAQLGLISMRWPGAWHMFPNFKAHVKAGQWFAAARECFFNESGNPGLKPRNAVNRWLFSLAGRVQSMRLPPGTLYYDNPGAHKLYLFKEGRYVRYDWNSDKVDADFPLPLSAWNLPAPFSSGVDAVVNGGGEYKVPRYFGKTYFFRDSHYVRYDWDSGKVDAGPSPLTAWGLTGDFATKLDAAVNGEGPYAGKLYFFRGDKYVRYDWATEKIDQAPQTLAAGWKLPAPFSSGIDAVVSGEGPFAGKLYFFKGGQYLRFQWAPYAQDGLPSSIDMSWTGLSARGFASDLGAAVNPPGRS